MRNSLAAAACSALVLAVPAFAAGPTATLRAATCLQTARVSAVGARGGDPVLKLPLRAWPPAP